MLGRKIARSMLSHLPDGEAKKVARSAGTFAARSFLKAKMTVPTTLSRLKPQPRPVEPIWPLPCGPNQEAQRAFEELASSRERVYYAWAFQDGTAVNTTHDNPNFVTNTTERPLQRFRHMFPWLLELTGGSLEGKTVLDISSNEGFWSIQCSLLGAEKVVGFDITEDRVELSKLAARAAGVTNCTFHHADFWEVGVEDLGGPFDIVLNLGFLYHIDEPLTALRKTREFAREHVVLDTEVHKSAEPVNYCLWKDWRNQYVTVPSRSAVELMLRQAGFSRWRELPVVTTEMPLGYLSGTRASWLVHV